MIELRLLGQLDLRGSEGEAILSILAQPKRAALLAYLAVARPNGFHRRDKLLGLFWPESDQERGRGSLRKALYLLRQSLGEEVIVGRGDEEIALTEGSVWCDAVAFEAALDGGNPEKALELYQGDLLEGFFLSEVPEFEHWLESERERLRRLASDAAWALAERAESAGGAVEACRHALRAAGFAPDDESTLRRLLELLDRVGDRAAAVKEYEAFARRLKDEYEAEPSPETQALIASIRQRESISDAGREPSTDSRAGEAKAVLAASVSDSAGRKPDAQPRPPSLRRALGTYALVSLAVLVAVHIFTQQLGLPDWVFPISVVVLLVGLPIIVGTALMRGDITASLGAVALALMALVLVAAAVIVPRVLPPNRSPSAAADAVSSTTVAVFPFAVRGADELAYLREGMVDLLSTALDGAGELRSVDPQALLSFVERTEPVTGPEQAGRVASHFGAGLYVLGSIVAAGDRIQLSAALYDLEGSVVRRAETRVDDESQLIEVVDDLTRQLLAAGVGGPGTRLSTLATLTTQSLTALKEYLRGENAFRGGQFDSAVAALQRAVTADSTFALGYYRLAVAGSYAFALARSDRIDAIQRASRFRDRLANRDRALVEAELAYQRGAAGEAERRFRSIVSNHPDDVDAWHGLNGLLNQYSPVLVRPISDRKATLERVLELDPDNVQATYGLAVVVSTEGQYDRVRELLERWLELAPDADLALARRAALAYARGDRAEQERILAELQRAGHYPVFIAFDNVAKLADDRQGAIEVATLLTDPSHPATYQAAGHFVIAHMQLAMGRWGAAKAALDWAEPPEANPRWGALAARATLAASAFLPVPPEELAEVRNSLEQFDIPSVCPGGDPIFPCAAIWGRVSRSYLAGLLSVQLEDYRAAERYAGELEAYAAAPDTGHFYSTEWAALAHDRALSVRAHAAWKAGRPQEALALIDQTDPERWWGALGDFALLRSRALERYLRAELLRQLGRDQEALLWYESLTDRTHSQVYLAPTHYRRAEIYERLGNREEAARHYRRVIEIWEDCDPELRPLVEQAEQRLAHLDSGSG